MSENPIRRAQVIAPFGVGSLIISKEGVGMIAAGLDYWYEREGIGKDTKDDLDEFIIREWRLESELRVHHFRLPPDFRERYFNWAEKEPNMGFKIPFLRFPTWHFCQWCRTMEKFQLTKRGSINCKQCEEKGLKSEKKKAFTNEMVQVPLIALCEDGHIQDFPWREWVHRNSSPSCQQNMKFINTGKPGLSGNRIECSCG